MPQRSTSESSFVINQAERKALGSSRRSSMIGWESRLEDVQVWSRLHTTSLLQCLKQFFSHKINLHFCIFGIQENEDDEYEKEKSLMEDTMESTNNEEGSDENDENLCVCKRTNQVNLDFHFIHDI